MCLASKTSSTMKIRSRQRKIRFLDVVQFSSPCFARERGLLLYLRFIVIFPIRAAV